MKKLDWYIVKKFLGTFFFSISLILIIVIVFDISEKIDDFLRSEVSIEKIVFDYYLNFIPYFGNLFSPLFIFISVIYFTLDTYLKPISAYFSKKFAISFPVILLPVLYCDTLMGINFNPDFYIDITEHFLLKKKAILKHETQKPQRFVDLAKLMNSYRAAQCNASKGKYAEAYSFEPSFPFTDIRHILPPPLKLRPFHIENQLGFL